jgi:16S rRNA (cytidine1402-2'-O)-methyltransferase
MPLAGPPSAPARSGRRPEPSVLYLCATPIGNLQDVTLRLLEVLRSVDLVACEDTRRTRLLLERHGINARLVSFHEHNEDQRLAVLLPLLREGKDVAVVSDAGMPGISDPGFSLVRACAGEGLAVTIVPGPSAVCSALALSGLPADRFAFVGFLARTKAKLLEQVAAFNGTGAAVVAFESPRRLRASLAAIAERWPGRRLAMCRELTKLHEEVLRGTAAELLELLSDPVRGEIALVLEPIAAADAVYQGVSRRGAAADGEAVRRALAMLIESGFGVKRSAGIVAELTGMPARMAYEMALRRKESRRKP